MGSRIVNREENFGMKAINNQRELGFATLAIHVGQEPDPSTGATIPPIHTTSTYTQASPGVHQGYEYSRTRNPTRVSLERCIAALEGGAGCAAFASGSAASVAVFAALSPGDKVIAFADLYGGTFRMLTRVFERWGLVPVFLEDSSPQAFARACDDRTKIVWIESPTNPLLRCVDIAAMAKVAHDAGAMLAVDNTFATPALQRPIALGADYVVHSTTKYIGGHSDVIGGAVVVRNEKLLEDISFLQNALGGVPGPFDCYLQQRGLKTLAIRMERHSANALALAEHLQGHQKLKRVIFPGLKDHPDYELAKRQMCGPGGMVTIELEDGAAARRFCESVKVFALAESLGGVESLVNYPTTMTHASIPKEIREGRGITEGLVRLSVGIEDINDLKADLDQALSAV